MKLPMKARGIVHWGGATFALRFVSYAKAAPSPFMQNLDLPATFLAAVQAGRYHPRIVEDQQILGIQALDQRIEERILDSIRRGIEHEQATRATFGQGLLCNLRIGQIEMEIAGLHGGAMVARTDADLANPVGAQMHTPSW